MRKYLVILDISISLYLDWKMAVGICAIFITLACFYQVNAYFPSTVPAYCNHDPASVRTIPPLNSSQLALVSNLEQVQVLIRHGARTPYTNYQCWNGYNIVWNNCNVTELMLASPSLTDPNRPAPWLFRKLYDGSPNYFNGNCYTGQLVSEGYTQEEANGQYLYDAYLGPNANMKLFPTNSWTDIDTDSLVYLRSDDEQRTLMSGQILLHTFFNVSLFHFAVFLSNFLFQFYNIDYRGSHCPMAYWRL